MNESSGVLSLFFQLSNMSLSDPFLSIEDVTFSYGNGRVILNDVTLSFGRGQVVAIMGGSGMGKTTLLKLIGGLIRPQKGRILFDGTDIAKADTQTLFRVRRKMGMLFQFGALFTDMSVFENVAFPLREQTSFDEEMIRDLVLMKLDAVGLRGAADLMPSAISGGMARRVALARAIALDPALIMYDEPFAGLDPISSRRLDELILQMRDSLGATIVVVTHELASIFTIADRAIFLDNKTRTQGAIGKPSELLNCANADVRTFLNRGVDPISQKGSR